MKRLVVVAFFSVLISGATPVDDSHCPEWVCRTVLEQNPALSQCSFVVESSGTSYYRLEFDKEVVARAFSSQADPKMMEIVGRASAVPLAIMAIDTDHPYAAVRVLKPTGDYAELTRQEYKECVILHGDPIQILHDADAKKRSDMMSCILEKLKSGGK